MRQLTKSQFLDYLACPEHSWLKLNRPEQIIQEPRSEYQDMLIDNGYKVERLAQQLFGEGPENLQSKAVATSASYIYYQAVFKHPKYYARVDILERNGDGTYNIIEVKSGSKLTNNHLIDLAFQKIVLESCGFTIANTFILHCNGDYVLQGKVIPEELFVLKNCTEDIQAIEGQVAQQMDEAITYFSQERIDESRCSCYQKTKPNHCPSFSYFNPQVPEYNVYQLSNIREKKLNTLLDQGMLHLTDVDGSQLTGRNVIEHQAYQAQAPLINVPAIAASLSGLQYPLYFYDYETYGEAIPFLNGTKPHQQVVFQVSIHKVEADGSVSHFEWLSETAQSPERMLQGMKSFTGEEGTFIVWNKSFENTRNKEMAQLHPAYAGYLDYINAHTFDLMDIFKQNYVDHRAKGSMSIKQILPLLCPELSYSQLQVKEGTAAQVAWSKLVFGDMEQDSKLQLKQDMLAYCKLDTWAMVRIWEELKEIAS